MKVRYKKKGKVEYDGREYHQWDVIEVDDFSRINPNDFEFILESKKNIELQKIKEMIKQLEKELKERTVSLEAYKTKEKSLLDDKLKTLEKELKELNSYYKEYKDREDALLKELGLSVKEETKETKKTKKEVE